jgi:hypothetical protein
MFQNLAKQNKPNEVPPKCSQHVKAIIYSSLNSNEVNSIVYMISKFSPVGQCPFCISKLEEARDQNSWNERCTLLTPSCQWDNCHCPISSQFSSIPIFFSLERRSNIGTLEMWNETAQRHVIAPHMIFNSHYQCLLWQDS